MKAYKFEFKIVTPKGQLSTCTVRDTDNMVAAIKEMQVLYPEATKIKITKHYRLR